MTAPARLASIPGAGFLGAGSFLLIGWIGLLIPSLIRSIESAFGQDDAGIGVYYFVFAIAYAGGSLAGGLATERLGRRVVLSSCAALMAVGLLLLAVAPSWTIFVLAALPTGLGIGALDGGGNGLFLDLFEAERGRALNLLHLCYSLGALSAPLVIGRLIDAQVTWQTIVLVTVIVAAVVAVLFFIVRMPSGRHGHGHAAVSEADPRAAGAQLAAGTPRAAGAPRATGAGRISVVLVLLAIAIGCGVAAESGISNWLVRFLDPAPLSVATTGLTLFWVGLALGRLVSARLADRWDHRRFALAAAAWCAIALWIAILSPWQPVSIAFFAAAGFGIGPVYPMIMVVAGERFPGRSAAVSGSLSSAALMGTIVYPPVMGLLSVTVGLAIAMFGNGVLALACAGALMLVGRRSLREVAAGR